MKKMLLLALLCCASLFAFSQKHADLSLRLISPADSAVIPFGDTAHVLLSLKNHGPDDILPGDTIGIEEFLCLKGTNFEK